MEKVKREPTRCLKCQGWNHFAKDCNEEKNTCGSCAGEHRSSSCLVNERQCVSCKTDNHASWSRSCPTFLRKIEEYNTRNPENSLQFFPTTDPWTWTSSVRLSIGFAANTPLPPPPKPRPTPNKLVTTVRSVRGRNTTGGKWTRTFQWTCIYQTTEDMTSSRIRQAPAGTRPCLGLARQLRRHPPLRGARRVPILTTKLAPTGLHPRPNQLMPEPIHPTQEQLVIGLDIA